MQFDCHKPVLKPAWEVLQETKQLAQSSNRLLAAPTANVTATNAAAFPVAVSLLLCLVAGYFSRGLAQQVPVTATVPPVHRQAGHSKQAHGGSTGVPHSVDQVLVGLTA